MKALRRIGLGILLLCGFVLAMVAIRSFVPAAAHHYDEELSLPRANVPAGSNAYDALMTAAGHAWRPKELDDQIGKLAINTNWDDALAKTVLASNQMAFAAWDDATKRPDFQVPEFTTFDDELPYLKDWKKLALLVQVRQNVLLHGGHDQEAFDQMVDEIKMGRRMQNAHGVLIVYLVGAAVNNLGLAQMQRWIGQAHLTPDQLKDYARQLELSSDAAGDAYANAIRAEYQMSISSLEAMGHGTLTNSDPALSYPHVWPVWPLFSLSRTKAMFATGALRVVKAAPHPYSEAKLDEMESRPGMISIFLSGNPVGQILYYMMMPAVASSLEKKSRGDVQLQATRTMLALRAYELLHGRLPPDLTALVPEFMDKVPIDDYDGKPLRYSADKKIVYSVGKNLKDDGGEERLAGHASDSSHPDWVFRIDF